MSPLKSSLSKLEARLQSLIEGSAARLFPLHPDQDILATRLITAMQQNIKPGRDGGAIAPNLFIIKFHPDHTKKFEQHKELVENLTLTIKETGTESGLRFLSPPVIRLQPDDDLQQEEIKVEAQISLEKLAQTSDLSPDTVQRTSNIPGKVSDQHWSPAR